ncbi:MAG: hypothetical protein Q7R39_14620 [Dehalococcoidia bacterium]|nr:hypothetical protein [Dehalococcoidia bacterium]
MVHKRRRADGNAGAGGIPKDPLIVFAASVCMFLAAAYFLAFQVKYALGDAMSRTFSAFDAVYGAQPHLATIGFIWPPLPTLLQIPLVLIKPLTYYGFSGMIVSALFGAGSLAALDMLYRHYGFKWWTRAILAAIFVGNPYIMFYAANGMSEIAFVFFFSVALAGFAVWDRHNQWRMVTLMGIAVTGAFYVRYDALALAAAFFFGIILLMPKLDADAPERIEGTLLAFSVLVGYGVAVWIFMNWSIMKDPLYFYRSEYSNLAITKNMIDTPQVQALQHSWVAVLQYGAEMMYRVSPLFTVLTPLLVIGSLVRRKAAVFVMLLISLSVPAFQVYMFRQGTTFGFDRFYISVIPATFILGVTVVDKIQRGKARLKALALPLLIIALAVSTGWTAVRVYEGKDSTEEGAVMLASMEMRSLNNFALDEEVASYVVAHVEGRQVLADSNSAERIVLFTQEPRLFVLTADPDFDEVLRSPVGKVKYILVQNPQLNITFDAILDRYPDIWTGAVPFTELEKDFGSYRLYRVKS